MKYGLIGEKLGHSFSKVIHGKIGDYEYEPRELSPAEVEGFIKAADFKGINVTIPYKQTVIPFLYEVSDRAKKIGAVNTIVNKDGKLYGDNTDYLGMTALVKRVVDDLPGKKVLILGSGGTSKTAFAVATDLGAGEVYRVSRSAKDGSITYEEAYEKHADADLIINTTPVGMFPEISGMPVNLDKFTCLSGVVDAIFNPLRTNLILTAQERGIKAEGGLYMLVAQAVYASELFLDTKYEDGLIDKIYTEVLCEKQNIVLIGMPKSGKSTVGRLLAKKLDLNFVDTDKLIVEKEGREITEIFANEGEAYFRKVEAEVIANVSERNGHVIATGGGAVLNAENIKNLKRNGKVFFLNRPVDALTPSDDRPLASNIESILKLYKERFNLYKTRCDVQIINNVSAENAAAKIERALAGKKKLLIINGPNLNMLGIREPDIYGFTTYKQLCRMIAEKGNELNVETECFQSNSEGELVTKIQQAYGEADGIVINPGAYTHTSVALLDALKAVQIKTVEVHISEVSKREDFRQVSYIRQACMATITGHGIDGYFEAMELLTKGK